MSDWTLWLSWLAMLAPAAGWIVTYSTYGNVTAAQKNYAFAEEVGVSSYSYLVVP